MKQTFWDKNKVFILGLLGAVAVAIQPFTENTTDELKLKVVGFAVLMAVLSFFAKEWRGQGLSIVGIVGSLAGVFVTVYSTGNFSWTQFALQAVLAIIAAAGADPKSRGYENSTTIVEAKKEGEAINPASLTKK